MFLRKSLHDTEVVGDGLKRDFRMVRIRAVLQPSLRALCYSCVEISDLACVTYHLTLWAKQTLSTFD